MSINRQYDRLGERLASYQRELLSVQANVTQFLDDFHQHLHWLDVIDTSVVPLTDFTVSSDEAKAKVQEQQAGPIVGTYFYGIIEVTRLEKIPEWHGCFCWLHSGFLQLLSSCETGYFVIQSQTVPGDAICTYAVDEYLFTHW